MIASIKKNEKVGSFSRRQQLFIKYTFFVLIDLTVLNLFNEYWSYVSIESFSISLLAALLLQILLQLTIAIEHRVSEYFKVKEGLRGKAFWIFSKWAILFISKVVILKSINYAFGDSFLFNGPVHGVVAFIIIVIAIIIAEQLFLRVYKSLA